MLDPRNLEPFIQSGIHCLQNVPNDITLDCINDEYILTINRSKFPIVTILGCLVPVAFIPVSILLMSKEGMLGFGLLLFTLFGAALVIYTGITTELIIKEEKIIFTTDRTLKFIIVTRNGEFFYEMPQGEPIQFHSRVMSDTTTTNGTHIITKKYTIDNTHKFGLLSPCTLYATDSWLDTFFNQINAAWYGVFPKNAPFNAAYLPPFSQRPALGRPYDRKKYEHATLDISDANQEITPVLHNMLSFDDDRYIPVPSEHSALNGRYHNLTKIGGGAQGSMYRALDENNQPVGIKVYNFLNFQSWKDSELFEREVETLKSLHFKGIPKYIELIDSNPLYYLVESYIPAPSMAKRMKNGERLSFEQALILLTNIAETLNYLESLTPPVIHRDIKPDNLLVDDEYNVWLVDFGVVAASNQKTNAMTFAGTAGYMAPEQLSGKVTPAADIYSAGISILAYLTGKDPTEMKTRGLSIDVEAEIPTHMPPWFKQLLIDMTEPTPEKRLSNAASIAAIIQDGISNVYNNNNNDSYGNPNLVNTGYNDSYGAQNHLYL